MRLTHAAPDIADSVFAAFDRRLDPHGRAPVAAAYSGGGDSLFLLLAARQWARRHGRPLLALHVDHQLQSQSAAWADHARAVAAELGATFRLLEWVGDKPTTGLAAAARLARLTLLANAARQAGAQVILLGHTADDVRESALMRAEGSTLGEMTEWSPSPMWPEGRDLFHFRPLLELSRETIRDGLRLAGWEWIEDPANENHAFGRARLRASLKSASGADWNAKALSSQSTRPDHARQGLHVDSLGAIASSPAQLADDPQGLKAALVCVSGGSKLPRTHRLERLRGLLTAGKPFTATLSGSRVEAGEAVLVCRDAGEYARAGTPGVDVAPDEPRVWDGRFELSADKEWAVMPLKGLAGRLPRPQREALRALPVAVRPSLPALVNRTETVTCPLLAEVSGVRVRPLVASRLAAALGLIRTEAEAGLAAHGAGPVRVLCSGAE